MIASCAAAFALSGTITNARDGDSAATSSSGPALESQLRGGAVGAESIAVIGFVADESAGAGAFPRSHATPIRAAPNHTERRNRFI